MLTHQVSSGTCPQSPNLFSQGDDYRVYPAANGNVVGATAADDDNVDSRCATIAGFVRVDKGSQKGRKKSASKKGRYRQRQSKDGNSRERERISTQEMDLSLSGEVLRH